MADISAIFGIFLALGIAFPGLLATFRFIFPNLVGRASMRLETTPWRCFWLGAGVSLMIAIPLFILAALPFGPAKLVSASGAVIALAVSALGAAGIAERMGIEMQPGGRQSTPPLGSFVRGAVALELAAFFPIIGWLLVLPVAIFVSLGAAVFALLRWMPGVHASHPAAETRQPAHEAA